MRQDFLGNPVSVDDDKTLAGIDDFIEGFLAYERRAENILAAADADPGCCLAQCYAGLLWMFLEAPEAPRRAALYQERAERLAVKATERERMNVALLSAWARDDMPEAGRLADEVAARFPQDLMVVKLHQYFDFNRGNFTGMLRSALAVRDAHAELPYLHGMLAFAYEQCHLLEEAELSAHRALSLKRKEPWAQHALAHVYLTRGHIEDGAWFLESVADTWTGLNSFMYTHNWWHLAVFYLSQGRDERVREIYDQHCWGMLKSYSQDQVGAVSLLARMELAGIDVGDRWTDLADHLRARSQDTVQPFLSVQYLYGLARAGLAEADVLLEAIRERARTAPDFVRGAWAEAALPAAEGLLAHARGDFALARRRLAAAVPRMIEAGGSHAQRDLFDQFLLDARLRSGDLNLAQQQLELRRAQDPLSVPINTALAGLYERLGLPAQAATARARLED
ncbi:MAG: tetratricopeptide repeat protein [Steroidobacteraceae bacterium]